MRDFNKIFGIGLSRTGTHSLTDALRTLGISAVHFPATFGDIERHVASTDSRVADVFEKLDAAFPGSLFIFTVRTLDGWLDSCERFWNAFDHFQASPGIRELHARLYGKADFDRSTYAAAYARHRIRIEKHFAERRDDLLEFNICGGEGWPPLAKFLETVVPPCDFPHMRAPGGLAENVPFSP